jgi:hypothetical protein
VLPIPALEGSVRLWLPLAPNGTQIGFSGDWNGISKDHRRTASLEKNGDQFLIRPIRHPHAL